MTACRSHVALLLIAPWRILAYTSDVNGNASADGTTWTRHGTNERRGSRPRILEETDR